ncbi:MAG TPA: ABC transporter ATP-binding protein [Actinomycetota bacterium]
MYGHGAGGAWSMMRRRELEKGRKLAPGTVTRALAMMARYKARVGLYLLIVVISAALFSVPPKLMQALIDNAIIPGDRAVLRAIAIAGIAVAVAIAGASLAARWISAKIGEQLIFDLRVALFDHVQEMPLAFFTRTQTGSLISRLNNDVIGAQSAMTGTLGQIVESAIRLVTVVVLMLSIEWRLTLLAMVLLPVFLIPGKRVGRRLQEVRREQMSNNAEMNTIMQERFNVSGAMVAKLFGARVREHASFGERAAKVRDSGVRLALYARVLFVILALVSAVGTAVVYWVGGSLAISGSLLPGEVAALISYVAMLYGPMTALTNARVDLMTSFVSFERVFEVLDLPSAITDAPDALPLKRPRGRVEFRDVSFRYPRAEEVSLASLESVATLEQAVTGEVLRGVSFVAEPGATVALVGPSGAGKTTISNLIPRLYDVTGGAVLIDGHDVRSVTQESLRAAIGVVAQDPHLFHDTIAANLRYARPGASDEEVADACRAAQIDRLIASLPDGYDTVVGERGYRFSGGEKQRIAIARVLLKAPPIVILDEATSHLDSESEALIQEALRVALTDRTSIVIAHRLSTIIAADEILVVDGGRIVQRGRHANLVGEPGTYADLYRTQFARAEVS